MKVLAMDIVDICACAEDLGAEVAERDELLKTSDYISLLPS